MRVLVTGDRNWTDYRIIATVLNGLLKSAISDMEELVVIDGQAEGADSFAGAWYGGAEDGIHAIHTHVTHERYPALWELQGKAAGPMRNTRMLVDGKPDVVIAFHNNLENSKGTKHMVNIAKRAGVPVYHIRSV